MTIDEAINLIQKYIDNEDVKWNSPLGEAHKLGFEAMKRVKSERQMISFTDEGFLPGETET